jgi:hypothetical protein
MNGFPVTATDTGPVELAKTKGLQGLALEYRAGPFISAGLKHLAFSPLLSLFQKVGQL